MDPTAALPFVMPGRFGILCTPIPEAEEPFGEGYDCVTMIPTIAVLREWAELIVGHWPIVPWAFWSPFRSAVVRYVDLGEGEYPIVQYSQEYFHRAGEGGFYDLLAQRQFLTMAQLFRYFTPYELALLSLYWIRHNEVPLVLDDRLPSLADHKAIQRWVVDEFQRHVQLAFIKFNWPFQLSGENGRLHCAEELAAQNQEREENLHRREYTIEGYEHFRFSMIFMRKLPKLEKDALAFICSFLLGRPIAACI